MVFVCEKIGKNTAFCFRKIYLKEVKGVSREYIHRFQLFPVYLLFLCIVFLFSFFFFISLRPFLGTHMRTGRAEVISYSFPLSLLARSFFGPYVPTVTKISTDLREKADCKKSIPNSAGQNGLSVNFKDNLFPVPILS